LKQGPYAYEFDLIGSSPSDHRTTTRIENYFRERGEKTGAKVECFDNLFPVVCARTILLVGL
jgi:hypothetical protein